MRFSKTRDEIEMIKLYVYEHCPYCTKARMIFGLKKIPFELIYLSNDDEETPIGLVGKKMLPIIQDEEGIVMNESLDIIEYIDNHFYPVIVQNKTEHFIESWLEENSSLIYKLCHPRWPRTEMPEFATYNARMYFTKKKEASIGSFDEHLSLTGEYLELLSQSWDALLGHEEFFNTDIRPIQLGDFHFFAAMKCLSVVKDLEIPDFISQYMSHLAVETKVPLDYDFKL